MPKVQPDEVLREHATRVIRAYGGLAKAASKMGLGRSTLWRLQNKGRAIERTRQAVLAAIKHLENETAPPENGTNETDRRGLAAMPPPSSVPAGDLLTIRSLCQSMMALVEMYEKMKLDSKLDAGVRTATGSEPNGQTNRSGGK